MKLAAVAILIAGITPYCLADSDSNRPLSGLFSFGPEFTWSTNSEYETRSSTVSIAVNKPISDTRFFSLKLKEENGYSLDPLGSNIADFRATSYRFGLFSLIPVADNQWRLNLGIDYAIIKGEMSSRGSEFDLDSSGYLISSGIQRIGTKYSVEAGVNNWFQADTLETSVIFRTSLKTESQVSVTLDNEVAINLGWMTTSLAFGF